MHNKVWYTYYAVKLIKQVLVSWAENGQENNRLIIQNHCVYLNAPGTENAVLGGNCIEMMWKINIPFIVII